MQSMNCPTCDGYYMFVVRIDIGRGEHRDVYGCRYCAEVVVADDSPLAYVATEIILSRSWSQVRGGLLKLANGDKWALSKPEATHLDVWIKESASGAWMI